jgi:hypothetical protein
MCNAGVSVGRAARLQSGTLFVVQILLALGALAYFFLAGFLYVSSTCRPGAVPGELARAVGQVLARLLALARCTACGSLVWTIADCVELATETTTAWQPS